MANFYRLFAFLICVLVFSSSSFALSIDEVSEKFRTQKIIKADYVQTKKISSIEKPLISSGDMLASIDDGVLWQQSKPFLMKIILLDDKMVQVVNNKQPSVITAKKAPQLFSFNSILQALFTADKKILEQSFIIDFHSNGSNFEIKLKPTVSPLDKVFSEVVINGVNFVDSILLTDTQGDKTLIEFSNQETLKTINKDEIFKY